MMVKRPRSSPQELIAQQVVRRVIASLPPELRRESDRCIIELCGRDEDGDLLGVFEGNTRADPEPQSAMELPRIQLFLDNLWDFTDGDVSEFRDEVKTTLLHELGHYLGLDEDEVEVLGLA